MKRNYILVLAVLVVLAGAVAFAGAYMQEGQTSPNYTGNQINTPIYNGNGNNQPTTDYQPNPPSSGNQASPSGAYNNNPTANGNPPPVTSQPAVYDIKIQNFAFSPATLTVKVGDTVRWTNEDTAPHAVSSDNFSSQTLSTGNTYEHAFQSAGTYSYICSIHPSMKGTIIVQ
jgi:plastocyanin